MGRGTSPAIGIEDPKLISLRSQGVEMEDHTTGGAINAVDVFAVGGAGPLGKIDPAQLGVLGFQCVVVTHIWLGQMRPALVIPDDLPIVEVRIPVLIRVVVMVAVKIPAAIMNGRPAPGTDIDAIF